MFHKEGFKIIIVSFLICAAIAVAADYFLADYFYIAKFLQLVVLVLFFSYPLLF